MLRIMEKWNEHIQAAVIYTGSSHHPTSPKRQFYHNLVIHQRYLPKFHLVAVRDSPSSSGVMDGAALRVLMSSPSPIAKRGI